MAKAKLTTRAISSTTVTSDNLAKASQLTHNQLDSNFLNLRDATFGVVADDSATIQVGMDSNLYIQGGDNVTTSTDSGGVLTINASAGTTLSGSTNNTITTVTGASAIQGEANLTFNGSTLAVTGAGTFSTTLGVTGASTLDGVTVNDNTISSNASNANLEINANGSGTVVLENLKVGTSGSTVTTILDEDAMGTDSATSLATQQSIKAYVDSKSHTALSGSTNNTITTVTGANAIQGEANATFDGSTLAITGNITATTSIANDAIKIDDHTISGLRSNDDITISPAGTGKVNVSGELHAEDLLIAESNWTLGSSGGGNSGTCNGNVTINEGNLIVDGLSIGSGGVTPASTFISGTRSNENIVIDPNGSGTVRTASDFHVTGNITVTENINNDAITLADNKIYTTRTNEDLELDCAGTGELRFLAPSTQIGNSTIHGSLSVHAAGKDISLQPTGAGNVFIDHFKIRQNSMTTIYSNDDFEIDANGSGIIHLIPGLKVGTGATVTTILDEDNMATDSATALATQQSIKKYIDDSAGAGFRIFGDDSAGVDIAEGGSLYLRGGDNVTTSTNSDGTLTITASGGGASTGDITFVGSTIISPSNADLTLNPAGTGKVNINAVYTLPNADGSANEVLGTNGSGVLSFRDPTAINIDGGVADSTYTSVPTIDGGTA